MPHMLVQGKLKSIEVLPTMLAMVKIIIPSIAGFTMLLIDANNNLLSDLAGIK